MVKKLAVGLFVGTVILVSTSFGQIASDNAGNYSGTWAGNLGTGWGGAWTFTDTATSGHFIGDSTTNAGGSSGGINSPGDGAWGLFANTNTTADASRPFAGPLLVGQTFTLQIDQGFQDAGSTCGFGLRNSSGQNLFELYYIGGDATNSWKLNDAGGQMNLTPNVGFSGNGFNFSFTITSATTYSGTFSAIGGGSASFNGTLMTQPGGEGVSQVRLFNFNAGTTANNDLYFNNMAIIPEPTTLSLLAGPAILGAWFFVRRRRS